MRSFVSYTLGHQMNIEVCICWSSVVTQSNCRTENETLWTSIELIRILSLFTQWIICNYQCASRLIYYYDFFDLRFAQILWDTRNIADITYYYNNCKISNLILIYRGIGRILTQRVRNICSSVEEDERCMRKMSSSAIAPFRVEKYRKAHRISSFCLTNQLNRFLRDDYTMLSISIIEWLA